MTHLIIDNFLDFASLQIIKQNLDTAKDAQWEDGSKTNAEHKEKINFRLSEKSKNFENILQIVHSKIITNPSFQEYTLIDCMFGAQVTKTTSGGKYGRHTDALYRAKHQSTGEVFRSDLSFTLFLNNPDEYEGGNLKIDDVGDFKLKAGSMILYPSTQIHEVTEVTSGRRCVFVAWVQSRVKNSMHRNLLYEYMNLVSDLNLTEEQNLKEQVIRMKLLREFCY